MDLQLKGRTALVTGGSRGIGFGVAEVLAAEGCNLHLASRSAADLEKAQARITAASDVKVTCHALDLGDFRERGEARARLRRRRHPREQRRRDPAGHDHRVRRREHGARAGS